MSDHRTNLIHSTLSLSFEMSYRRDSCCSVCLQPTKVGLNYSITVLTDWARTDIPSYVLD